MVVETPVVVAGTNVTVVVTCVDTNGRGDIDGCWPLWLWWPHWLRRYQWLLRHQPTEEGSIAEQVACIHERHEGRLVQCVHSLAQLHKNG